MAAQLAFCLEQPPSCPEMSAHHQSREKHIWRFDRSVLDEGALDLQVNGQPVHLHRKPMLVLLHLLDRAGDLVTKDELAATCWPQRVISDTVLTTTINRLRAVLGDRDRLLIRTVHGFGYRFDCPVQIERRADLPRVQRAIDQSLTAFEGG